MAARVHRTALFAAAGAGIFVVGIVIALLGTVLALPEVRARMQLDLAGQGNLFLVQFFGLWAASMVSGAILDRFGGKALLTAGAGLVAAALAGFAATGGYAAAAASALLLGCGGGVLNTGTNALVAGLYDRERGSRLSLLGVFFGVGALVIPLTAATLLRWLGVTTLLGLAAALAAGCAGAYASLRFPPAREGAPASLREGAAVLRFPGVALSAALLFMESGNESTLAGWTSTYVVHHGWDAGTGSWVLSGYWAALLAGRLAAARFLATASPVRVVFGCGVGSAIGALVLMLAGSLWSLTAGVILCGLSHSAVYPTVLAMAGARYPSHTGTVFGALFSIALVGGMLMPWGVGQIGEAIGLGAGLMLPMAGGAAIAVLITIIAAREARRASANAPTA